MSSSAAGDRAEALANFIKRATPMGWLKELTKDLAGMGVTWREVFEVDGRDRHSHIVQARHYAWAFARDRLPGWSTVSIGKLFGVDHSSILNAFSKLNKGDTTRDKAKAKRKVARPYGKRRVQSPDAEEGR